MLVYYNQLDVLGWDGAKTVQLGDLRSLGMEGEVRYQDDHWNVGANYAYTKQLDWKSAAGVSKQGISYADYHVEVTDGPTLEGKGNSLHNTPEHAAKIFATWREPRVGVSLHVDLALFWGYKGRLDGLRMYEDGWAQVGGPGNDTMVALAKRLRREGYGQPNAMLNASIGYRLPIPVVDMTMRLVGRNLLGFKRYFYDSGDNAAYPTRLRWTEEPATAAVTLDLKY